MNKFKKIIFNIKEFFKHPWYYTTSAIEGNHTLFEIILTGLALFLALLLYGETQRQADISEDSFDLIKKNTQIELRAYVGISNINVTPPMVDSTTFFVFDVKNFGKTPANDVSFKRAVGLLHRFDTSYLEVVTKSTITDIFPIAPEVSYPQIQFLDRSLTKTDIEEI